jgi:hypothetical protein
VAIPIPLLAPILIVAGDARLAALASCALARRGAYLRVVDGPRMFRPDRASEIIRRTNAAARVGVRRVILAGLPADEQAAMAASLPSRMTLTITKPEGAEALTTPDRPAKPPVQWGRDRIGVGLLRALQAGASIAFEDVESPPGDGVSESGHMVVCEAEDDLAQVIAANYAFALGAGLKIIPKVEDAEALALLETLYDLYGDPETAPSAVLAGTVSRLRAMSGDLAPAPGDSFTFVSRRLPYGLAYPEAPSTHLFAYPDLGIAIINGLAAEQRGAPGVNVALMIDPGGVEASEIEPTARGLAARGLFVSARRDAAADVSSVDRAVSYYPYDLLLFATHCGDPSGCRWTYEFVDSEGRRRELVVDVAIGVGQSDDPGYLSVMQHTRFHMLDGVAWNDPAKDEKLYVGTAILDWVERTKGPLELKPVKKVDIARVAGAAAMKMYDHNYLPHPTSLAGQQTPLILNNACTSWHELAVRFTFASARGYIGTLFEVTSAEAYEIAVRLLGQEFGHALPLALWNAQNEVYSDSPRRPYVMTGVYCQRFRTRDQDTPAIVVAKLEAGLAHWQAELTAATAGADSATRHARAAIEFHEEEIGRLRARFLSDAPAPGARPELP